jgi:hypothetical protein
VTRLADDALDLLQQKTRLAEERALVMRLMNVCDKRNRPLTQGEIDTALGLAARLRLRT